MGVKNYLDGKRDLAKDILDKIEKGYGKEDILDLIKAWGNTNNMEEKEEITKDFCDLCNKPSEYCRCWICTKCGGENICTCEDE